MKFSKLVKIKIYFYGLQVQPLYKDSIVVQYFFYSTLSWISETPRGLKVTLCSPWLGARGCCSRYANSSILWQQMESCLCHTPVWKGHTLFFLLKFKQLARDDKRSSYWLNHWKYLSVYLSNDINLSMREPFPSLSLLSPAAHGPH